MVLSSVAVFVGQPKVGKVARLVRRRASRPGWMRFFAITLAGAGVRAVVVEVAVVLEEVVVVVVAVAIAGPFSPKGAYARTREFGSNASPITY
jgi:hypothetical protein